MLADPAAARKADVSTILSGYALDEFNAQVDEWEKEGVHQEGVATVESAKIVESADDGSSFVLEACVDSADVRVLNEAGMDLRHDQTTRWLTDFTFVRADGAWKLDNSPSPTIRPADPAPSPPHAPRGGVAGRRRAARTARA